mgnify:CR=1 FL=1
MMKLNKIIDMVEVGMRIGLNNNQTGCFFGGTVIKKLLMHDAETHEEYYRLSVELDDMVKEITDLEKYEVYALIDKNCRDILSERTRKLEEHYFPAEGYMDDEVATVFWEMVSAWKECSEAEKSDMAEILMKKMKADYLEEIMDEVSRKHTQIAEIIGLFDTEDDFEDEEDLDFEDNFDDEETF